MFIRHLQGQTAENIACAFLQKKGLKLVEKNFLVKGGEIDLIMLEKQVLVFVEVRFRARQDFGGAAASVHLKKQRRIILAARHYLMKFKIEPQCRFDCVLFEGDMHNPIWLQAAFSLDDS